MKQNYLIRATATVAFGLLCGIHSNAQEVTTFDYTGDVQTYTVPVGVTSIQIEAWGAQGQALTIEDYSGSTGGLGGYAVGTLTVTPGEVLNIYVGGTGTEDIAGYNGGGLGGYGTPSDGDEGRAGSGGGASDVRQDGTGLADRIIVAGGGGGGGRDYVNGSCQPCGTGGNGGFGGALIGGDGDDPADDIYGAYFNPGSGGSGGTGGAGGAGGDGTEGVDGNPGVLGVGGDGIDGNYSVASGGGGGGYYGGGAGAGANSGSGAAGGGGAGGSSYLGSLDDASTSPGIREGNGQIIITELCMALETEVSATEICEGDELLLSATSTMGGSISWDDPEVTNGEFFTPSGTGVVTYTATSDADDDCGFAVEVTINEVPEVEATADETSLCIGDEITVTGDGSADSYEWNNDAEDGVTYVPDLEAGIVWFTVVGIDDETECTSTDSIEVFVSENPEVVAVSDKEIYCEGDIITLTGTGADSYTWDMGVEDGVGFEQPLGTETYVVVGLASSGCDGLDSIDVTVVANPEITVTSTDEIFGGDGSTEVTVDSGEAPFTFDWDNDGSGDFDDDQNLTDLPGGTYTVTMMDDNGCLTTVTVVVGSQLSIDELGNMQLVVYPNPTLADLTIVQSGYYTYELTALSGELVLKGSGYDNETLDLSGFSQGIYLLNINAEGTIQTVKVVKK